MIAIALIDLPWSPDSWTWWALHEGTNVTTGVPLSVSYDLENEKTIDLWLLLPPLEAANEYHEITISATASGSPDTTSNATFEAITKTVKRPELVGYPEETAVSTDSTYSFNATAWNIGNAPDSTIRARVVLSTSPPSTSALGFLSTSEGGSAEAGQWINLNLGPTESVELIADVIIDSDIELDTRISIRIELEGGQDDLGRPILQTLDAMLLVSERRLVELDEVPKPPESLDDGTPHLIWINLTSTSTQGEILFVNATAPEGWGVICDGMAIHLEGMRVEFNSGDVTNQIYDIRCEIIRESGSTEGEVIIDVTSSDGTINHTINSEMNWILAPEENELLNTTQILMIVGGVVLLGVIVFMLRKFRGDEEEDDEYEDEKVVLQVAAQPTQGPPATAFSGPPASSTPVVQQSVQQVDPAMQQYQLQVEEYNRKMAEYEAWQASQNSQQ